uniref:Uncharacterized protein n=1 Tax=viral metagenome TaxID=1070528 RepID=A0A6C0M0I3_9ZZZZ
MFEYFLIIIILLFLVSLFVYSRMRGNYDKTEHDKLIKQLRKDNNSNNNNLKKENYKMKYNLAKALLDRDRMLNTNGSFRGANDSICYNANKTKIDGCECHGSCKTCGYDGNPVGFDKCLTCANNSEVNKLYTNNAGWCNVTSAGSTAGSSAGSTTGSTAGSSAGSTTGSTAGAASSVTAAAVNAAMAQNAAATANAASSNQQSSQNYSNCHSSYIFNGGATMKYPFIFHGKNNTINCSQRNNEEQRFAGETNDKYDGNITVNCIDGKVTQTGNCYVEGATQNEDTTEFEYDDANAAKKIFVKRSDGTWYEATPTEGFSNKNPTKSVMNFFGFFKKYLYEGLENNSSREIGWTPHEDVEVNLKSFGSTTKITIPTWKIADPKDNDKIIKNPYGSKYIAYYNPYGKHDWTKWQIYKDIKKRLSEDEYPLPESIEKTLQIGKHDPGRNNESEAAYTIRLNVNTILSLLIYSIENNIALKFGLDIDNEIIVEKSEKENGDLFYCSLIDGIIAFCNNTNDKCVNNDDYIWLNDLYNRILQSINNGPNNTFSKINKPWESVPISLALSNDDYNKKISWEYDGKHQYMNDGNFFENVGTNREDVKNKLLSFFSKASLETIEIAYLQVIKNNNDYKQQNEYELQRGEESIRNDMELQTDFNNPNIELTDGGRGKKLI